MDVLLDTNVLLWCLADDPWRVGGIHQTLGITMEHTAGLLKLPMLHKDPFDRLIIAQALHDGLPVLSSDRIFADYGVRNLFFGP